MRNTASVVASLLAKFLIVGYAYRIATQIVPVDYCAKTFLAFWDSVHLALLLAVLFSLVGCGGKEEKILVKEFYNNGKLSSSGWYKNDNNKTPVDTIYKFFENGNLSSISVYDSGGSGQLNGLSLSFYENGNRYQVSSYVNGLAQGFFYEYNNSGKLETKQFYFNGKVIGDHIEYDEDERPRLYAFYWTDSLYVDYIEYDSSGMIKKDANTREVLFNYITKIKTDTINNFVQRVCNVSIIPSNPPKCLTKVYVHFISKNNRLMKNDSISNVELFQHQYILPDSLKLIRYTAVQHDSILNKNYISHFETKIMVEDTIQ